MGSSSMGCPPLQVVDCLAASYPIWMNLDQEDVHERFQRAGTGPWTLVCDSWYEEGVTNGGVYIALAPQDKREKALGAPSWNLSKRPHGPGFSQYQENGEWVTVYERGREDRGFEPLVLARNYHGVVPDTLEIVEEFRLYHNLYWDELTQQFMKPHDDGTSSVAAKVSGSRIEISTKLIRQYQAARQLDLVLFIDSVRFSKEEPPENFTWRTEWLHAGRYAGQMTSGKRLNFTRYLATRVLPPPPVEKAGIWPYEEEDDYFPDFIIGLSEDGDEIRYTCNEDALANYFGANPEAPHYLTPVHFRREVLQKYYDKPELYTVEDGYLRCVGLWGVQIDNSAEGSVVVFLGDLGRDLPKQERDYWRSFNIAPEFPVSETFFRRSFLAQPTEPAARDLQVRSKYVALGRAWKESFGWDLFRKPEEADAGLLQRLRLPLNDSQAEFESTIRIMTQLFVDALNESEIKKLIPGGVKDEKGIAKLERWLTQESYEHVNRDVKFLRELQMIRSQGTAHRKSKNYEETLAKVFGTARGPAAASMFFDAALAFLAGLDEWLASRNLEASSSTSDAS